MGKLRTDSENGVDIVHGLCPDVGELLDLLRNILDLVVGEDELELLHSRLDLFARETSVLRLNQAE